MLTLTTDAAAVIRSLVEAAGAPDGAGLRITARPLSESEAALEIGVAGEPEAADEVVEREGAQVFLEPAVAAALADKVLDASVEAGGVRFQLLDHAPDEGLGPAGDGVP